MTRVTVCIPTFRRPDMLRGALAALSDLRASCDISVIVADNDAERCEGAKVVRDLALNGYRFPLSAIIVGERGISQSRNALLTAALDGDAPDYVAFVDDDQLPYRDWLTALLEMCKATDADVVGPAVIPIFEVEKHWVQQCKMYRRDADMNGPVDIVAGTGGVLLKASAIRELQQPWFDPALGLIGGEDYDFFLRLRDAGSTFARASHSQIGEIFPTTRTTLRWALLRAFRGGNSATLVALKRNPKHLVLLKELPRIAGALFVATILLVANVGRPGRQVDALARICSAAGKAAALGGRTYKEYANS